MERFKFGVLGFIFIEEQILKAITSLRLQVQDDRLVVSMNIKDCGVR